MNLKDYEQIKFELAEVIRSGQLIASERAKGSNERLDVQQTWRDLIARLAEDRFTVVAAGRFNRGKSSLMNAVLGLDRLPTGIVPLTSVITYVRYGTSERVLLDYEGSGLRGEAALHELPQYVTEKGNPGNIKRIRSAEIQLPAEILRRGVCFVDTPGLGSAIFENTRTTERFIPEIDVLILVTSYESPLTEDEIRFLQQATGSARAIFIVVNKQDLIPPAAREEVLHFVEDTACAVLGTKASKPFSVSARDGLAAKQARNFEALRESGILTFETALLEFLTRERARLFLTAMCERVFTELRALPEQEAGGLFNKLHVLQKQLESNTARTATDLAKSLPQTPSLGHDGAQKLTACEICKAVMDKQLKFLGRYQYDLSTQPRTQEEHAQRGGFCPLHTWHYEQVASPRGVCTAYPALLNQTAVRLRSLSTNGGDESRNSKLLDPQCPACEVRRATEDHMIASILDRLSQAKDFDQIPISAFCLPHLQLLVERTEEPALRKCLLAREAALMERIAEDMQRYAIKHDGLRRHLASREEQDAYLQALQLLVGHRNVNAIFTVRDIL
jgi:GTP-binding protein EngB required for normal cell division